LSKRKNGGGGRAEVRKAGTVNRVDPDPVQGRGRPPPRRRTSRIATGKIMLIVKKKA
jgi:hypothetical protein